MDYKVLLIDDEPKANESLKDLLSKHEDFCIETCTSAKEALKAMSKHAFKLIFLDINMPEISGLELVKDLSDNLSTPPFVFVSAYSKYMPQAFKVQPFDFLTKPVDPDELDETIERFRKNILEKDKNTIALNTINGLERIDANKIMYAGTNNRKLTLHTIDGQQYIVNGLTLTNFLSMLPNNFVRANKQDVVNMNYAYILHGSKLSLAGKDNLDVVIEIGRVYQQNVKNMFNS
ncbi:MAG: LytR/AlgR family response regulator transcription factor [Bacteroidales bacterium]